MIRADILTLIKESPVAHGAFDPATEIARSVYCNVQSVGMREVYEAKASGFNPEIKFTLSDYAEYRGEKLCVYHGVKYRIIRTYVDHERIELTCERDVTNGRTSPTP